MKTLSLLEGDLTPQARAVLRAFADAQTRAPAFLVSAGVFPELSESGAEKLQDIVCELAERHFDQKRVHRALRTSLDRGCRSTEARDQIENPISALLESEATAAYLFGLAAGLSLASAGEWLTT
jgi:hypothetical protein